MHRARRIFALGALVSCLSVPALAEDKDDLLPTFEDDSDIITLVYENDIFAGTDKDYTNGFRAAWLSPEDETPDWVEWAADHILPVDSDGRLRYGVAVGQNMYTPSDITKPVPGRGERPYAGWLYGSLGVVSDTGKTLDNVMLSVGMVGPASLAEPTQRFVHKVIDSPKPRGWDYQLDNEPGVVLTMERKWRNIYQFSPFGTGMDLTPHVGMNLGNVYTDASVGATFRLGYDLPADYGPPRIRPSLPGSDFFVPSKKLGGYLFAGFEGRAVARNIFLDGNTFQSGPSVDKRNFVGSIQAGAALVWGSTRLSYTHVLMTKEYDTQASASEFGALTLSQRF